MQHNGGNGPRDDRNRQYARLPRQPQTSPVRPPENRPVRKKRRRNVVKPRFFVFLAVCVLLLVGLFSGVRALVRLLVNNDAAISYGMIEDVTTVDALIVRSETCVRAESYGKIDYLVPEESYVSAGTPVVNVYATGYSGEKMTELENLMTDIQQRQKQALGSIINVTIDDYNNSISAQTAAIRSAIAGDPAQLDTLDQQLRTLMSARQDYIEKTTEAKEDATLAQYYASKTQLQSQISTWMTQYPADNAGFVSFTFDGLEPYLNPDTLDALDGAAVKELLRESNPAVPDELRSQQNLYRLVQPNEWYVVFTTKASTWKIGIGETCALYFRSYEDITYNATVRQLSGTGDELVVILEMSEDVSPLLNARKLTAVIGGRVEGMMVPLSALKTEGSQQGVYLMESNTFVPVRVVGQDSKHALIMPLEDGALTSGTRIRK